MARDHVPIGERQEGPFTDPRPALIAGLAAVGGAFFLWLWIPPSWALYLLWLILPGLLATGIAVAIRPRSPWVLALAAIPPMLASFVMPVEPENWDSARLLLRVLAVLSLVAAGLVWMPRPARRAAVSLLIVFHFGGILSAVTNVPTTGASAPWLSSQLWVYVYRPYLQFMYLNNAYHFYSPDPGPASLVWFRVEYEPKDGRRYWRWVKVPELQEGTGRPLRPDGRPLWPYVEYTRRLSMGESINLREPPPPDYPAIENRRKIAAQLIPPYPTLPLPMQYSPPNEMARQWLASYVRHVAQAYPHQEHPELKVKAVKVYRVVHRILTAPEFARGVSPEDPTTYLPCYLGEYGPDGKLTLGSHQDPFLYWVIPIIKVPRPGHEHPGGDFVPGADEPGPEEPGTANYNDEDYELKDYLKLQSGDLDERGNQP